MPRERNRHGDGDGKAAKPEKAKKKLNMYGEGTELGKTISDIKKRMGEHVVTNGMAASGTTFIETGVFLIDYALLGGLQESRVNQLYGNEACGKTTIAMRAAAASQRKYPDQAVVFIDAEGTFDPLWAERHGVDNERLITVTPESGEECVDVIDAMIRTKETCSVILDSLPAIVPQKMIDNSAEDATVAIRARLIGVACSKILAALQAERARKHHPTITIINQWRTKIGVFRGDPRTLPGGAQPKYLSSVMLELKKRGASQMGKDKYDNDTALYNEHAFDVDKLKGGSSLRQGEFRMVCSDEYRMSDSDADMPDINLPAGSIDEYKAVITYGKRMGFITGGGASWTIDEIDGKFKRLDAIVEFFHENPDEMLIIKRKMIALKRKENGLPPIPKDGYLLGKSA